jgi:hypothetical protein
MQKTRDSDVVIIPFTAASFRISLETFALAIGMEDCEDPVAFSAICSNDRRESIENHLLQEATLVPVACLCS